MRTQFFYTRKETITRVDQKEKTETPVYVYRKDSFNLDKVVRSIEMQDGSVLVLLNDIHERTVETPNINPRNNKVSGTTRKRDTYQSEIYLSKEDGERFYQQTAVEYIPERPIVLTPETVTNHGDQETAGTQSVSGVSSGTRD